MKIEFLAARAGYDDENADGTISPTDGSTHRENTSRRMAMVPSIVSSGSPARRVEKKDDVSGITFCVVVDNMCSG